MSLVAIAAALGLTAAADESACLAAINSLKQDKQTALNAAHSPNPDQWKPKAEFDAVLARASTAEAALNAVQQQSREAEITAVIDQAQADGKVIPATRDYYLSCCQEEGGLERFKKALPSMPVIGKAADRADGKPPASQTALNAEEQRICTQLGLTPEEFLAAR